MSSEAKVENVRPTGAEPLCDTCKAMLASYSSSLVEKFFDGTSYGETFYKLESHLERTAKQGCPLCMLFFDNLKVLNPRKIAQIRRKDLEEPF
jgi:hypothetical protein